MTTGFSPTHRTAIAAVTAVLTGETDLLVDVLNDTDDILEVRQLACALAALAARLVQDQAELMHLEPREIWRRHAEAMSVAGEGVVSNRRRGRDPDARYVETEEYVAFVRRILTALGRRVGEADIAMLSELADLPGMIEVELNRTVTRLREAHGYSWADIGEALGGHPAGGSAAVRAST